MCPVYGLSLFVFVCSADSAANVVILSLVLVLVNGC